MRLGIKYSFKRNGVTTPENFSVYVKHDKNGRVFISGLYDAIQEIYNHIGAYMSGDEVINIELWSDEDTQIEVPEELIRNRPARNRVRGGIAYEYNNTSFRVDATPFDSSNTVSISPDMPQ